MRALLAVVRPGIAGMKDQDEGTHSSHRQHAANGQDGRVEDGQSHGADGRSSGPDPTVLRP